MPVFSLFVATGIYQPTALKKITNLSIYHVHMRMTCNFTGTALNEGLTEIIQYITPERSMTPYSMSIYF